MPPHAFRHAFGWIVSIWAIAIQQDESLHLVGKGGGVRYQNNGAHGVSDEDKLLPVQTSHRLCHIINNIENDQIGRMIHCFVLNLLPRIVSSTMLIHFPNLSRSCLLEQQNSIPRTHSNNKICSANSRYFLREVCNIRHFCFPNCLYFSPTKKCQSLIWSLRLRNW
jgi:hypothetical protein